MDKLFLGIDQSFTSSGICVVNEQGSIVFHETINTTDADGDIFDRALKIAQHIIALLMRFQPMRVGLEGLAFSKFGNATRDLAGLQFVLVTSIREHRKRYSNDLVIVSPNLLKKFATKSGSADKDKMYEAVPEDVKTVFSGYKKTKGRSDVVDAYWLAKYALDIYNKDQTSYSDNRSYTPKTD